MFLSFMLNCCIVVMVAFAIYVMFTGWDFMGKQGELESEGLGMLRYFTVDSNILMGVCSLVMAVMEAKVLWGTLQMLPVWVLMVKLAGTSAVTLTLMVTVFFLTPQFKQPLELFFNANLFFHLLVPLIAIGSFLFIEHYAELPFGATFWGLFPTLLYAAYYIPNIFLHLKDGKVSKHYDFYNFLRGRKENAWIAMPVVGLVSYAFAVLLWLGNRLT